MAGMCCCSSHPCGTGPITGKCSNNGDPTVGREVFEANCAMCHGQDASGMMGMHGNRGQQLGEALGGVSALFGRRRMCQTRCPSGKMVDYKACFMAVRNSSGLSRWTACDALAISCRRTPVWIRAR